MVAGKYGWEHSLVALVSRLAYIELRYQFNLEISPVKALEKMNK